MDVVAAGTPDPAATGFAPDAFRHAMRLLAGGVVVVTTRVDGRPWGLTVSACCSLTAAPPRVLVSLDARTAAPGTRSARRSSASRCSPPARSTSRAPARRASSRVHRGLHRGGLRRGRRAGRARRARPPRLPPRVLLRGRRPPARRRTGPRGGQPRRPGDRRAARLLRAALPQRRGPLCMSAPAATRTVLLAQEPEQLPAGAARAVAIGNFDGVHLGHRRVISAIAGRGLQTTVVTFDPIRAPSSARHVPGLLLPAAGAAARGDGGRRDHGAALLARDGGAGAGRRGSSATCSRSAPRSSPSATTSASAATVAVMSRCCARSASRSSRCRRGDGVSSTRVRDLIGSGRLDGAAELLGRPHGTRRHRPRRLGAARPRPAGAGRRGAARRAAALRRLPRRAGRRRARRTGGEQRDHLDPRRRWPRAHLDARRPLRRRRRRAAAPAAAAHHRDRPAQSMNPQPRPVASKPAPPRAKGAGPCRTP